MLLDIREQRFRSEFRWPFSSLNSAISAQVASILPHYVHIRPLLITRRVIGDEIHVLETQPKFCERPSSKRLTPCSRPSRFLAMGVRVRRRIQL